MHMFVLLGLNSNNYMTIIGFMLGNFNIMFIFLSRIFLSIRYFILTVNLFLYLDTSPFTFSPEQTNKNILFHPYKRVVQTDAILYLDLSTIQRLAKAYFYHLSVSLLIEIRTMTHRT